MKPVDNIAYAYFLGIGGIGMSALARYLNEHGVKVYGYDRTPSAITDALINEGISIGFEDEINTIPQVFERENLDSLVVYTPAIPNDSKIKKQLLENGHSLIKRAALLGEISKNHFTIAVAGTHGKTTTSTIISHIVYEAGYKMVGILGGISTNYSSNYIIQLSGKTIEGKTVLVTEADEFDRSFLQLHPNIAVITSTDADHLDIYGTNTEIEQSFQAFANQIKPSGTLILNEKANITKPAIKKCIVYGNSNKAEVYYDEVKINNGQQTFDWNIQTEVVRGITAGLPGLHNIENAIAAATACLQAGIKKEEIVAGVSSFKGVKRRFEYVVKTERTIVIDDYAHHPSELDALIDAVKTLYPQRAITLIFQPHLYSRTRDFAAAFSKSLSEVDCLRIMPIYPARELPIEGVSSEMLLEKVTAIDKGILTKEAILEFVQKERPQLLLIAGAGDIDRFVGSIKDIYHEQYT